MSSITKSRSGRVLIRLANNSKRTELEEHLKSKLDNRTAVRGLVVFDDVEILDLDCITTAEDITYSIHKTLGILSDDTSIQGKSVGNHSCGHKEPD